MQPERSRAPSGTKTFPFPIPHWIDNLEFIFGFGFCYFFDKINSWRTFKPRAAPPINHADS